MALSDGLELPSVRMADPHDNSLVARLAPLPELGNATLLLARWLSRGSVEVHTAQSHPIIGTPWDVPLPKTITSICLARGSIHPHGKAETSFAPQSIIQTDLLHDHLCTPAA